MKAKAARMAKGKNPTCARKPPSGSAERRTKLKMMITGMRSMGKRLNFSSFICPQAPSTLPWKRPQSASEIAIAAAPLAVLDVEQRAPWRHIRGIAIHIAHGREQNRGAQHLQLEGRGGGSL